MKNNVRIINLFAAISMSVSSTQVYAIDLNTKIQNTDKADFNTINSPFRFKNKKSSVSLEYSNTKNPLILKRSDGSIVPLIEGLTVMEFSMLYGITDSLQLGILIPGENPYGIVAPFNDAKKYIGNILIEPKIYLMENIAFIPLYYIPGSSKINGIGNDQSDLDLGKEKGGYGAKLSIGFGDKEKSDSILTAVQVGAIMAPESTFRINPSSSEIDQTQRLQFGAGISYPVSGTMRLLVEAYGEKTKNNTPMESIATIEYKNDNFMLRLGGGTGDLQGSGSNTVKVLANFTYYFGSEKETAKNTLSSPTSDKFKDRIREIKRKDNNDPILKDEQIEEQNEPTSGQAPLVGIVRNDLMIEPRRIPINATRIPVPKQKPIPEPDNHVFVLFDRKRSKDDFFLIGDDDDLNRILASESSALSEEEIIFKAKENIKNAIKLIDNNLYLHKKAQSNNDQEKIKKFEIELRWGLRVYKRNIKTLNDYIKNVTVFEFTSKVKEAQNILDGILSGQVLTFFVGNTKAVVKSSDNTESRDNLFLLTQGEEVIVLGNIIYGDYVQIKMEKGRFEKYEYPMFINKKYLSKREENTVLAKDKSKDQLEVVVLNQLEVEAPLSKETTAKIQKQLDELEKEVSKDQLEVEAPFSKETTEKIQKQLDEIELILEQKFQEDLTQNQESYAPFNTVVEEKSLEKEVSKEEQLTIKESNKIKQDIKEEVKKIVENHPVKQNVETKLIEESVVEKEQEIIVDKDLNNSLENLIKESKKEVIVEPIIPQTVDEEIPALEQEVKVEDVKILAEEPVVDSLKEEKVKFRAILDSELDKADKNLADKKSNEKDELLLLVNEAEEPTRNIKATDREMVKKLPEKVNSQKLTPVSEIRKDFPSPDSNKKIETIVIKKESPPKVEQSLESKKIAPTPVIIEEMTPAEVVVPSKEIQENKAAETPIFLEENKVPPVQEEVNKFKNQSVDTKIEPNKVEIINEEEKTSMKALLLQDVKKEEKEKLEAQIKFEKDQQEKQKMVDKVEKERLDAFKTKELDQIDQYLELKAQSKKDVNIKDESLTKDRLTEKETASSFKELIKKSKESDDVLDEEGEIEEQNGPSFDEI